MHVHVSTHNKLIIHNAHSTTQHSTPTQSCQTLTGTTRPAHHVNEVTSIEQARTNERTNAFVHQTIHNFANESTSGADEHARTIFAWPNAELYKIALHANICDILRLNMIMQIRATFHHNIIISLAHRRRRSELVECVCFTHARTHVNEPCHGAPHAVTQRDFMQ